MSILREEGGRGPFTAKTYALDDLVLVVAGTADQPAADRAAPVMRLRETIEQLTGRSVWSTLSQKHPDPQTMVQLFFMDEPAPSHAVTQVTAPR